MGGVSTPPCIVPGQLHSLSAYDHRKSRGAAPTGTGEILPGDNLALPSARQDLPGPHLPKSQAHLQQCRSRMLERRDTTATKTSPRLPPRAFSVCEE